MKHFKRILMGAIFLFASANAFSQSNMASGDFNGDTEQPTLEFFSGIDLSLRDMNWDQLYDVMIRLTPGMKWNIGHGWKAAMQGRFTVLNSGYDKEEWKPQFGVMALSKEMNIGALDTKVTGGIFSDERYGLDLKARYRISDAVNLGLQAGYTGMVSTVYGWRASELGVFTARGYVDFLVRKYQTQIRMEGGRYLYGDYGGRMEVIRHFNHCSVGVYAQTSSEFQELNGGFKVVMMIPPYMYNKGKKVRIRPASNFRLAYNMRGDMFGCKMYSTDPEENERNGWFDNHSQQWERRNK